MMENREDKTKGRALCGVLAADWPAVLLILGGLIAGVLLYPHLPDRVPSHWNIRGEVDAYSSKFWSAFGIPLMTAGIYVMMLVLPALDPRKQNYARFAGAYRLLKLILAAFFSGVYLLVVTSALGYPIPVDRAMQFGVSLLILLLGNLMGQLRHNYFVGIKTPWTLASETVWQKTHRFGGRVWVTAGFTGILGSLIGGSIGVALLIAALAAAGLVPIVYSYLAFRKLE